MYTYLFKHLLEKKHFPGKFVNNYCGSGYVFGRILYPVVLDLCSFMIGDTSENTYINSSQL